MSLYSLAKQRKQPVSSRTMVYLFWVMLVSDQILCPDAFKICQILCRFAIQRLQIEVEVLIAPHILQVHDVLGVLRPAELPEAV